MKNQISEYSIEGRIISRIEQYEAQIAKLEAQSSDQSAEAARARFNSMTSNNERMIREARENIARLNARLQKRMSS